MSPEHFSRRAAFADIFVAQHILAVGLHIERRRPPREHVGRYDTMFLIESTNAKNWRWISGLVATRAEAELQLAATSESQRHFRQNRGDLRCRAPNLFMIEAQGFEFGDIEFIRQRLRLLSWLAMKTSFTSMSTRSNRTFFQRWPGRDEAGFSHFIGTSATLPPSISVAEVLDSEMLTLQRRLTSRQEADLK
ncbi:hypothetical protein [Roseateles sp.]|uniref:hypothetical protein n=1 Tax=Roseateles sp. TaxID=1971397 RepID=UPI00394FFF34